MTVTEQVKILNDKIKAKKAQYDLDREAAKISALSSGELENYEYLTVEDLGYKPDVIQKAKFEHSPLGKVFNKGLDKSDEKDELLKRLKNIEGKNKDQLDVIKDQGKKQLNVIKDQGKKQLDVIEKQKENKPKVTERDKIVYLKDEIDELLEMHPNSFDKKSKTLLKTLANIEYKIDYKNLSYKILFPNDRFHEISILKKYGTLYSLSEGLITSEKTMHNANVDQISFMINLMHGLDMPFKGECFYNTALTRANKIFKDSRANERKQIKAFFPKNLKKKTLHKTKKVFYQMQ